MLRDPADIIFAEGDSNGFDLHIGEPYELPFDLTVKGVLDFGEVDPDWFYDEVAEGRRSRSCYGGSPLGT